MHLPGSLRRCRVERATDLCTTGGAAWWAAVQDWAEGFKADAATLVFNLIEELELQVSACLRPPSPDLPLPDLPASPLVHAMAG